ncbi:L-threonylcarbamoyladenylate synthase [Yoonia sp. MH D7]
MTILETTILASNGTGVQAAGDILQAGGLVAFPTETVYGLGADARNDRAVAAIYAAKGRPSFNPLIVHLPDAVHVAQYCHMPQVAKDLAAAFWPGALTLVLPLQAGAGISALVTAGLQTLAVRVPDHALARDLLIAFGGPVAAPSANPSGRISPTSADHVIDGLSGKIDAIVDGGSCVVGLESTIVDCTGKPALLRAGGISAEEIEACLGYALLYPSDLAMPNSPGQLLSHYAPQGSLRLNAVHAEAHETWLGFGAVKADLNLSVHADLHEAAANLFKMLHQLDAMGAKHIAVSPIPETGLGHAINDRLKRAAAPRD